MANMAVAAWIKFVLYPPAAGVMTVILALGFLYLAFVHARWVHHVGGNAKAQTIDTQARSAWATAG